MPSYSRHSCQWLAYSAQHRVMLSLQLWMTPLPRKNAAIISHKPYIYIIYSNNSTGRRVHPRFRVSKSIFSNPFFFYLIIVICHPRIEFSPANKKKYARIKKEKRTCSPKIVFCIACVLNREHVCSQTCSPQNMVFTTPLTKRVDFAFFIIVFSRFSRTKNNKKKIVFTTPLTKRGDFACKNNKKKQKKPLTFPLTSLTSTFRSSVYGLRRT